MQFYSGYNSLNDLYGPMDRPFYDGNVADSDSAGAEELGLGVKDIGMSVPMGISAPNVQGIYGKIRSGVSKMEIGFPGAVSGNRQAHTPEMYGKDQRQAIRELGMINRVDFTTHAAYQIMGMTGAVEQGGDLYKFDMNRARMGQHEVERAIDFAADVSGGGSVVVHTGEYERPLTDMYLMHSDRNLSVAEDGRIMFKKRLTEDKDAKFYLIDDRNGQAMSTVEKDRLVAFPEWNKYTPDNPEYWDEHSGKEYVDENGNTVKPGDYINYRGEKVLDPADSVTGRVPEYDKKTGRFKVTYMRFEDFRQEADEKNAWFEIKYGRAPNDYERITQTEAFLQATLETNEGHSRGWALQYGERMGSELKMLDKLYQAKKFYQELDKNIPEEEKWKIMKQDILFGGPLAELVPPDTKNPVELINNRVKELQQAVEFARQASTSQEQQAEDTAETKRHIVDPIKYVDKYAIRHYTETALHAMERSADPNNPVVITMENIFPERFGGHPEELMWLIQKAREKFVEYITEPKIELGLAHEGEETMEFDETGKYAPKKLTNTWYRPNITKEQAQKLAEQHIKATIDTGHLNMWRKYFQPKQGATPEENEAEFKQWYVGQIEDLAKNNMIGNVHLTDNFGYQDDHLAPGQGNAPIKETVAILKKYGYDKALTVEPGADASTDISDFHGLMKTWRYFGSKVYGLGAPPGARQTWGQIQYSYFGQNQPPYFIFGAYAPSNDWTLWSEVPME